MIRRINEEKAIISPGCATCTARCGNTDNYDMSLLWNAPDEIRKAKLSILKNAQALAEKLMQTKSEEVPEGTIPRLYHALFMVKEDWDAKPLQDLAEDIADCIFIQ